MSPPLDAPAVTRPLRDALPSVAPAGDTYPKTLAIPAGTDAWLRAMGSTEGAASVSGLPQEGSSGGTTSRKLMMGADARKQLRDVEAAWARLPGGGLRAGAGVMQPR